MPFEYHYRSLRRYLSRGYTIELENVDTVLHPKWNVDPTTKHVIFGINLTHKRIRTRLEDLLANRPLHIYKGRVEALFDAEATEDDMTILGLTLERLGTDKYVEFLKKYRDRELTNQYVKSLILPFSPPN